MRLSDQRRDLFQVFVVDALERLFRDERELLASFLSEEFTEEDMITTQNIQQAWYDLQSVPAYVERYAQDERYVPVIPVDFILHDEAHPFCDDWFCPCHSLAQNYEPYNKHIGYPMVDGLLTDKEGMRLWMDQQIRELTDSEAARLAAYRSVVE